MPDLIQALQARGIKPSGGTNNAPPQQSPFAGLMSTSTPQNDTSTASIGGISASSSKLIQTLQARGIKPSNAQTQQSPTTQPTQQDGGLAGFSLATNPFTNLEIIKGGAKEAAALPFQVASLGKNIGNLLSKIPGWVSPLELSYLATKPGGAADVSTQTPSALQPTNTAQKLGAAGTDIGEFLAPGGLEEDTMKAIGGYIDKLPEALNITGKAADAVVDALKIAAKGAISGTSMGGVEAVQSGGDAQKTIGATELGAGAGVLSEVLPTIVKNVPWFKKSLGDSVSRALGISGRQTTASLIEKTAKAQEGLSVIADNATGVMVKDINGVEHAFDPSKATFYDTLQAWQIARDNVYKTYTDLAVKAGDEGATFGAQDFNSVISDLQGAAKNSTAAFKNKTASLLKDIADNYGTVNPKTGDVYYKNIPLSDIQSFLEKVNTDVNPSSDAAGAKVSLQMSQSIREILDNKIQSYTGEGYQDIRNQYASLKSIEQDLGNQFKKVYKGSGGWFGNYVEGFGGVDAIMGLLTKSPSEAIRGGLIAGVGKLIQMSRDPERGLRSAFDIIQQGGTPIGKVGGAISTVGSTLPYAAKGLEGLMQEK